MLKLRKEIEEAVNFIRAKSSLKPEVGIILGTGLGNLADQIDKDAEIPYDEIPHFPVPTVPTHVGKLILGRLSGKDVVAMQGRFHYYEGYSMKQITFPVRVMGALGIHTLIVSNACGGMNPLLSPGDIMIMIDHINLMGDNPLIGPNDDELGPRFPDMSEPYDRKLIELAERIALEEGINEYRFLRTIGADVVGMSTVPEDIVAVHSGIRVLGLSVVTDKCLPDALKPADIDEIIRVANEAEPRLGRIVKRLLKEL